MCSSRAPQGRSKTVMMLQYNDNETFVLFLQSLRTYRAVMPVCSANTSCVRPEIKSAFLNCWLFKRVFVKGPPFIFRIARLFVFKKVIEFQTQKGKKKARHITWRYGIKWLFKGAFIWSDRSRFSISNNSCIDSICTTADVTWKIFWTGKVIGVSCRADVWKRFYIIPVIFF